MAASDRAAPVRPLADRSDIVEADFETVPRIFSDADASPVFASALPAQGGLDMLRGASVPRQNWFGRGGPAFWTIGIGLICAAFWVSGGHTLFRTAEASTSQRQNLRLTAVTSRVDATGANAMLFVDGEAVNDGGASQTLPPFDIVVRGNDDVITRYRLGTADRLLKPSERFGFSSRLEAPKSGVKTVLVTFAN